jgi:hypothetical protein
MERSGGGAGGDGWVVPGAPAEGGDDENGQVAGTAIAPTAPTPPTMAAATTTATTPPSPGAPGPPGAPGAGWAGSGPAGPDPVGGALATAGPLAEPAAEVPRLDLRPMTVADIVDGAFTIVKARPARIFGIAALFVVPMHLLLAYLQRNLMEVGLLDLYRSSDPAVLAETEETAAGENLAMVLGLVLPGIALVVVAAAIARLVRGWSLGEDAPAGELLRATGRSWWALLASFVVVHVAEGLACGVGIIFLMPMFAVTAPVIGAEGAGPLAAVSRSFSLAGRRYWPTLAVSWLIGIVAWLLTNALGGLPQAAVAYFGTEVAWPLLAAGNILGAMVTTPFVAAATVLLYLDLRIRTEGLDIELTVGDLLDDAPA